MLKNTYLWVLKEFSKFSSPEKVIIYYFYLIILYYKHLLYKTVVCWILEFIVMQYL